MPLICSDASGEDGWGACAMGFHVVGRWPPEWRQSAGKGAPDMLFKELVPVVVMILLLAPWCSGAVFASALDNAGSAFVLNALSCNCSWSLALLRPFVDTLSFNRVGLIADHAHREFNEHTDIMSHVVSHGMWTSLLQTAKQRKSNRVEVHFVVHDMRTHDFFAATMSFARPFGLAVDDA